MKRRVFLIGLVVFLFTLCPLIVFAQSGDEILSEEAVNAVNTNVVGETGSLVSINHILVIQVVSFLIFMYLMGKFAFNPIREFMKKRSNAIAQEMQEAEEKFKKAEASMHEAAEEMEESKREAFEVIQRSQDEAKRVRDEILEKAKTESEKVMENARLEINRERAKAVDEIRSQVAEIAVDVAEKVLARKVESSDDNRLVEEAMNESGRLV